MATYDAAVRKALPDQRDLQDRRERCAVDAARLATIGRAVGQQVRVKLPADFDIRAWRARHGLPARIDNPAVIEAIAALLARDLTPRLAASGERSRWSQGRTGRRSAYRMGPADADSA
jgi:hypothetical protein